MLQEHAVCEETSLSAYRSGRQCVQLTGFWGRFFLWQCPQVAELYEPRRVLLFGVVLTSPLPLELS